MPPKLTNEQRSEIIRLLSDGTERQEIARRLAVTPGQVSAVAAHLTMQTYTKSVRGPDDGVLADALASVVPQRPAAPKGLELLLGSDCHSNEPRYWNPTPENGTPNPHLLIIGESGAGKTYALQCLCAELVHSCIPVVTFDFGQGFTVGASSSGFLKHANPQEINASRDGININPLDIFPTDVHGPVNVAQRVADTFARVYPAIGIQQHAALRDAIVATFESAGIDPRVKRTWQLPAPRFADLKEALDTLATDPLNYNRRYAATVAAHISTVFVFNTFRSTGLPLNWDALLSGPPATHVLQFKGLEHLLEQAVTELLLWNLIGYLESIGPGPLRCVVVLDEAHRLSFAANSPVEKLLREGRKFGLATVLASQQPEDFSSVAFANTATKLIFNISDDRGVIARQLARRSSASTSADVIQRARHLKRGHACLVDRSGVHVVKIDSFEERALRFRDDKRSAD